MPAEVLTQMGTFTAYAAVNLTPGQLVKWHSVAGEITPTGAGERPVGVVISAATAGEIVNKYGAVEFFKTAGIVKVPVDYSPTVGAQVQSGADGAIVAYTNGYAFGQVLDVTTEGETTMAEIYIY